MNPRVNAIVTLLDPEQALTPPTAPPGPLHGSRSRSRTSRTPPGCARPTARSCSPTTSRRGLPARRAPPAGRRGDHRQDEHARVRRRLADVQPGLRRHEEPARPDAGRPAARAAAPRRPSRRAWSRSPTARTSARASATPPRSAASYGPAPNARPDPGPRPRRPVEPVPRARRDRPQPRRTSRCSSTRSPAPTRATRSRSRSRGRSRPPATDPKGLRIAWSRDLGGLPVDPEVTAVLERAPRTLEALGCTLRTPSPTSRRRRVLRGAPGRQVRRRLRDDRRRRQADAAREHPLRPAARRDPDRQGARAPRRDVHAHARVPRRLRRPRRARDPGRAVQRRLEYPTEIAGVEMGSYLEWFRSCSRITVTGHPALAMPAGFTPGGLPIGLQLVGRHRGELALLQLAERRSREGCPGRPRPHGRAPGSYQDAEPRSFWLRDAHELHPRADRAHERRPVHRRRRLHRPVGGALRGRAGPRRRRARSRDRRVRRQRPQRRLRGRLPHARHRERPRPLRGRDADARAPRAGELRRHPGRSREPRHRLRLRGHRRAARAHRRATSCRGSRRSASSSPASATRSPCSTRRRCRPRSTHPRTSAVCGTAPEPASSTPASSPPACETRPYGPAYASTSIPPSITSSDDLERAHGARAA